MVRAHILFQGRVQGVGFRFTAKRLAETHKLLGWVKNLSDGRVEMMVEGPRDKIEHFIFTLESRFTIDKKECDWLTARNQFNAFDIAY